MCFHLTGLVDCHCRRRWRTRTRRRRKRRRRKEKEDEGERKGKKQRKENKKKAIKQISRIEEKPLKKEEEKENKGKDSRRKRKVEYIRKKAGEKIKEKKWKKVRRERKKKWKKFQKEKNNKKEKHDIQAALWPVSKGGIKIYFKKNIYIYIHILILRCGRGGVSLCPRLIMQQYLYECRFNQRSCKSNAALLLNQTVKCALTGPHAHSKRRDTRKGTLPKTNGCICCLLCCDVSTSFVPERSNNWGNHHGAVRLNTHNAETHTHTLAEHTHTLVCSTFSSQHSNNHLLAED